jgi:hypothetical protein
MQNVRFHCAYKYFPNVDLASGDRTVWSMLCWPCQLLKSAQMMEAVCCL